MLLYFADLNAAPVQQPGVDVSLPNDEACSSEDSSENEGEFDMTSGSHGTVSADDSLDTDQQDLVEQGPAQQEPAQRESSQQEPVQPATNCGHADIPAQLQSGSQENSSLQAQLQAAELALSKAKQEADFWKAKYERKKADGLNVAIIEDSNSCLYYTGLPSRGVFYGLFRYLEKVMVKTKKGPEPAQTLIEEFFMVLVRLRTGMPVREVARNFSLSISQFSKIFSKWILFLQKALAEITRFPTLAEVAEHQPRCFRDFPDTRLVIDGTEIRIQTPSSMDAQRQTFSPYKHGNTMKVLVGATPNGYVSFVSKAWGGSVSDRDMVLECGLFALLEPGDAVMMDKGFKVFDLLPAGVKAYMPSFNKPSEGQMSKMNVTKTRKIASARVHIERVIRRIKEYHILDDGYPVNMADIGDAVFQSCAFLSNFKHPLIADCGVDDSY
ncbi:uncharacterized protein LOC121837601 [Ixodes scapularis]|uniref:uncharacterized protein LOC121837601 n=1 Tax=Ixodes scapularis TaxID=6945 RepID=UPI001C38C8AE|nr:uncharacterized protein LOC121837601 [Ixodes scapularis]